MFIVQSYSNLDDAAASMTVVSRQEALAMGTSWKERGKLGIRIIGDGRIYSLEEFASTIGQPDSGIRSQISGREEFVEQRWAQGTILA